MELIDKEATLLMTDNRGQQRLLKICDNRKFKWRKIPIELQELTKYPYGSTFEIANGELRKVQPMEQVYSQEEEPKPQEEEEVVGDNREIYTEVQAQKLQHEEIEAMKKEIGQGTQIIEKIVEGNQQFEKRTQYSKEKYMKRKKAKYLFYFTVLKAGIVNVSDYYFLNEAKTTGYLRWDMLGLVLHYAGISQRMLVVDRTKGLISGALILKGCSSVTVLTHEDDKRHPSKLPVYQNLNISKEQSQKLHGKTLTQIIADTEPYTALVLANDNEPHLLIEQLSNKLQSGSFITAYSQFLQPLSKLFDCLLNLRKFINIQLQDTFTRKHQVLRNRTHPMMSMHGFGGYLLTAIKVDEQK